MKLRAMFAAACLLGCTAGEDVLEVEPERPVESAKSVEPELVVIPTLDKAPTNPTPPTLEPPPTPEPTPPRWALWHVLEDANTWLRDQTALATCDVELPTFPTISADGTTLALGLVSAPVADERLLTVRMLRIEDAKQMRAYTLVGPGESELPAEELERRICHRADALARALKSRGHTSMPVVGGWENPIRDGLPEVADGWPRVISDGATRDVDMAVADVVIAPANTVAPELKIREAGAKPCRGESGQFSKVWEAGGLRVYTRGPCGC